jgi:hypothetical protein
MTIIINKIIVVVFYGTCNTIFSNLTQEMILMFRCLLVLLILLLK